jgi:VanZ family protein
VVTIILACYWLTLFIGTHLPSASQVGSRVNDKVLHFGAYCGLSLLLAWACVRHRNWKGFAGVLAIIAGYGLVDEWSQMLVPARTAEFADWIADLSGGLVGLSIYWFGCSKPKAVVSPKRFPTIVRRDAA